jgi:hypothetical protein
MGAFAWPLLATLGWATQWGCRAKGFVSRRVRCDAAAEGAQAGGDAGLGLHAGFIGARRPGVWQTGEHATEGFGRRGLVEFYRGVRSGRAWHVCKTSARRLRYAAPGLDSAVAVRWSSGSVYWALWAGKMQKMWPEQIEPVEIGWAEKVRIRIKKISGSVKADQIS